MTFDAWFRQQGSLIPMSWPDSREKQDMELARAAWDASREELFSDLEAFEAGDEASNPAELVKEQLLQCKVVANKFSKIAAIVEE